MRFTEDAHLCLNSWMYSNDSHACVLYCFLNVSVTYKPNGAGWFCLILFIYMMYMYITCHVNKDYVMLCYVKPALALGYGELIHVHPRKRVGYKTHPCSNSTGGMIQPPLKLWHSWVIKSVENDGRDYLSTPILQLICVSKKGLWGSGTLLQRTVFIILCADVAISFCRVTNMIMTWISDFIHNFIWGVITHPFHNFK